MRTSHSRSLLFQLLCDLCYSTLTVECCNKYTAPLPSSLCNRVVSFFLVPFASRRLEKLSTFNKPVQAGNTFAF